MTRAAFAPADLAARLAALEPNAGYLLAFSGGLDSTVLLHALKQARPDAPVRAVHVDHGWHADAPRWAERCVRAAAAIGVACRVLRLPQDAPRDGGLEAAARRARYALLATELAPGEVLLTAHHADDQAETVLLMALRGSGLPGLAAMPRVTAFGAGRHARPLLDFERAALGAWAAAAGLEHLEDPSNADPRRDRNLLRAGVLPVLRGRWPALATTLGRVAAHAAEAQDLLAELGAAELAGGLEADGSLRIEHLERIPAHHRPNLLRHWFARAGLPAPPQRELDRVLDEVVPAARDRRPLVTWPGGEVRGWRGRLYARVPPAPLGPGPWAWDLRAPLVLPDGSRLTAAPGQGPGLALAVGTPVEVRLRSGGERVRLAPDGPARALKDLLQERAIPPWRRARLPLIHHGGELVAVADLCVAAAARGTPGLALSWQPA